VAAGIQQHVPAAASLEFDGIKNLRDLADAYSELKPGEMSLAGFACALHGVAMCWSASSEYSKLQPQAPKPNHTHCSISSPA
jgi:hypothetical protein